MSEEQCANLRRVRHYIRAFFRSGGTVHQLGRALAAEGLEVVPKGSAMGALAGFVGRGA